MTISLKQGKSFGRVEVLNENQDWRNGIQWIINDYDKCLTNDIETYSEKLLVKFTETFQLQKIYFTFDTCKPPKVLAVKYLWVLFILDNDLFDNNLFISALMLFLTLTIMLWRLCGNNLLNSDYQGFIQMSLSLFYLLLITYYFFNEPLKSK